MISVLCHLIFVIHATTGANDLMPCKWYKLDTFGKCAMRSIIRYKVLGTRNVVYVGQHQSVENHKRVLQSLLGNARRIYPGIGDYANRMRMLKFAKR
jgi:hypothetical protein